MEERILPSPPCPEKSNHVAGYSSLLSGILTAAISTGGGWMLMPSQPDLDRSADNTASTVQLTFASASTTKPTLSSRPPTPPREEHKEPETRPVTETAAIKPPVKPSAEIPTVKPVAKWVMEKQKPIIKPPAKPIVERPAPEPVVEMEKPAPKPAIKPVKMAEIPVKKSRSVADKNSEAPVASITTEQDTAGKHDIAEKKRLLASLRHFINQEKTYPRRARRAGYTGSVTVRITISPEARISAYEITEVNGHRYLRRGAEITMQRLMGKTLGTFSLGQELKVVVPISYRLR